MNTILKTKELKKSFPCGKKDTIQVLRNVDLNIQRGEFVSVMGPSGSGKSTLLYAVSGMDKPNSGDVLFEERNLAKLPEKELSKIRLQKMGFIFQHMHLLKNLTLLDNIILAAHYARKKRPRTVTGTQIKEKGRSLMEKTGIAALADNAITQASGGQLQRAAICRALMNDPAILFGDEPTGALNSTAAAEIMDLIANIHRDGTTVMLVTHDVKVAARSERVLFMLDGAISGEKKLGTYDGAGEELKAHEEQLSEWLIEQGI